MRTKIFLTSAMIMMVLCPARATQGQIDAGVTTANCSGDPLYYSGTERTSGTLTYTAQWTANRYSVRYDKGAHAAATAATYTHDNGATYDQNYTIPTTGAEGTGVTNASKPATGYTFVGWNTEENQTTANWNGETPWNHTSNLTVYAAYAPKTYNVIYAKGDHAASGVNNYTHTNGATYDRNYSALGASTTGVSAATGYVFLGYVKSGTPNITRASATAGTLNNAWTGETPWQIDGNLTVTAAYLAKQYTVTYDCNGGTKKSGVSSLIDTNGATYGSAYTFWNGKNTCEKNGAEFSGWSCVITGTTTAVNQNTNASSWATDGAVTCSAQWGANLINLRWNSNGGTPSSVTMPQTCSYGTVGGISDITQPTRAGYTFNGWQVTGWTE